ncbi:ferritin-like fold-containing protein [Phytomonospora sp. NPDC050363]|uniref:ferritin-like fold-containing protein n=1 Tax=Phytomonospora sp. NPDC050363 TaxID=3155642 RepID=UPI0033C93066
MSADSSFPASESSGPSAQAVTDLLGALAYGSLVAFDRMAADARLAPDLNRRAALSTMAGAEIANYRRLSERIGDLGADPAEAMGPFVAALDDFHEATAPRDWLEGLVKAYVGDGIADDFYREIANFLDEGDRALVLEVLHDSAYTDFAVREIRAAIEADPKLANRLALWARRLVGEALTQAQRVAAERDALTDLVVTGSGDLAGIGTLFRRLTQAHADRMETVGLSN